MKRNLYALLFSFHLFCFTAIAQNQAAVWYFGYNAGLDFNSSPPTSLPGNIYIAEGCASICDNNGSLLFYTNGNLVYNHNLSQMPNGYGLNGGASSSQAALIIPQPGSSNIYYIFTTAEMAGANGFEYSTVDMSLQSGLGDVVNKNIMMHTPVSEKLTAIQKTGSNDIWIVVHEYYSADFYAYLLTSTGLNTTPVITTVGSVHSGSGTDNAIGYMKISPDGKWLALALSRSNDFELFNFDAATGIPSNPIILPATNYTYGIEFSRSAKILYAGEFNNKIYQYDLTAGSAAAILASQSLIGQPVGVEIGSLQMAPDGKIYVAKNSTNLMGVINNPEGLGAACDFVDNDFAIMAGGTGIEGLPNFYPTFFYSNTVQPGFAASDTSICEKFCVDFTDASTNSPTAWQWFFPGGSPPSSTDQNPASVCYQSPGTYDVTLITSNAAGNDTVTFTDYITVNNTPAFPTITQVDYTLTSSAATAYQWQFNSVDIAGATNQSYDITQSGYYTVIIADDNGCTSATSLYILIEGIPSTTIDNAVQVYPNPVADELTVKWSTDFVNGKVELRLFNLPGQIVFNNESPGVQMNVSSAEIQMKEIPPGVYFLEIESGKNFVRNKIVVTH